MVRTTFAGNQLKSLAKRAVDEPAWLLKPFSEAVAESVRGHQFAFGLGLDDEWFARIAAAAGLMVDDTS